jgi:F0F1-type ATP synthase assembly protein I
MSKTAIIITSILIVGVGVGSFFIGRSVGKKSATSDAETK